MDKPSVAVFGASRFGKWYVRELLKAGCEVSAILGSTYESARKASNWLSDWDELKKLGLSYEGRGYSDAEELIEETYPDAVLICTPQKLHYEHAMVCLKPKYGIKGIFIEKPANYDESKTPRQNLKDFEEIYRKIKLNGTVYSYGAQFAYLPELLKELLDVRYEWIQKFRMDKGMMIRKHEDGHIRYEDKSVGALINALSHPFSVLMKMFPKGTLNEKTLKGYVNQFESKVDFEWGETPVEFYCQKTYDKSKKGIKINLDGKTMALGAGDGDYQEIILNSKSRQKIPDPLRINVELFIGALNGNGKPLLSLDETLKDMKSICSVVSRLKSADDGSFYIQA